MTEYPRPPSFDFGAATLQGFNLPGGRRYLIRVALWTSLIMTLVYAIFGTPIVKAYIQFFQDVVVLEQSSGGSDPDPEAVFAMMLPMFRAASMILVLSLAQMFVFAAAETAIYRNLLHGEDKGLFPLRFGMDEWRVLGTRFVVGIILGGLYFALYIVALIIGLIFFGIAGAFESGILAVLGGLVTFALIIAAVVALIWVAIRLAPSSAYSVRDGVFNPVASWKSMQGRIWPALGSYLILYIIGYIAISIVLGIIFMTLLFSSGIMGILIQMDETTSEMPDFGPVWEHVTSAGFLIPLLLAIFVSFFLSIVWYGLVWAMWGYFAKTDQSVEA